MQSSYYSSKLVKITFPVDSFQGWAALRQTFVSSFSPQESEAETKIGITSRRPGRPDRHTPVTCLLQTWQVIQLAQMASKWHESTISSVCIQKMAFLDFVLILFLSALDLHFHT